MNLLKTKFYPVDIENELIYIAPFSRERDLANLYSRGDNPCIGLTGTRIMSHKCYDKYRLVPTVTKQLLLKNWMDEAARSLYLWESAARTICSIIRDLDSDEALKTLIRHRREYRQMAISASYDRAVCDIKELLHQQKIIIANGQAVA